MLCSNHPAKQAGEPGGLLVKEREMLKMAPISTMADFHACSNLMKLINLEAQQKKAVIDSRKLSDEGSIEKIN